MSTGIGDDSPIQPDVPPTIMSRIAIGLPSASDVSGVMLPNSA